MLWLIPALPLLGAIVAGFLGPQVAQESEPLAGSSRRRRLVRRDDVYAVVPLLGHGHEAARIRARR